MFHDVSKGIYRHYEGEEYEVVEVGTHTESNERLVVYKLSHGSDEVWIKPVDLFLETVQVEDETKPRFEKIS
jgi:hypothetical protein